MQMSSSYFVNITDPFADRLTAQGLQQVLVALLEKQSNPTDSILWTDCVGYVRLDLDVPISDETVQRLGADDYIMPIRFIRTDKNAKDIPPNLPSQFVENYEDRKAQNAAFYEAVRTGQRGSELPPKPLMWDVLRTINPAALPGWTNILSNWWVLREYQSLVVGLILDLYSQLPNPVNEAADYWKQLDKQHGWGIKPDATCQQFFNPDQGKGQNRAKADAVTVGNMSGFWLPEFLKMVGFYHDAVTRTVAGGKDRKIFVIEPRRMSYGDHAAIMERFKPTITSEASTRFDILAALRYCRVLLDHYFEREPENNPLMAMLGESIQQNLVGGFRTAFYMDLGNAVATMNVSAIALPGWVSVPEPADVPALRNTLDELITFTRQFEEKNSDAFTLLQHLRDFVSGDDLEAFFRLTTAFSGYYMGQRERGKYAYQLTIPTIERIISMTNPKLSDILQSEGFRNIAAAIRQSTVLAQYRKANGDRLYDIRYGLGQDLTRVARKGKEAEFMAALADFIHLYNAENARIYEVRKIQYRKNVTTDDLNEITALLDEYGAPTIARLLVAYGYARQPKDEAPEEIPPEDNVTADDN